MKDDKQLLIELQSGDQEAFKEMFTTYNKWLHIVASGILEQSEAEEIVQELFVDLWKMMQRRSFPQISSLRSFLFVSVKNRCLNKLKSNDVQRKRLQAFQFPGSCQTPMNILESKELLNHLTVAVQQLPSMQSKVFHMGYVEQQSRREIAERLGISEATVKNHMGEALKRLRATLKSEI